MNQFSRYFQHLIIITIDFITIITIDSLINQQLATTTDLVKK